MVRTDRAVPAGGRYRERMDIESPTFYADLLAETALPQRGILSQTLSNTDGVELVLFAFAAGESLSEHTSARPAILHVLSGEGDLTVAGEAHSAGPGTWVRMPRDCRHSVTARTPLVMALYLLPAGD
jgi:quercetin dioxygenase-like cupin family protein